MTLSEDIQQHISRLAQMLHRHHQTETLPADTQAHLQALRSSVDQPDMLAPEPRLASDGLPDTVPDVNDPESTQDESALRYDSEGHVVGSNAEPDTEERTEAPGPDVPSAAS